MSIAFDEAFRDTLRSWRALRDAIRDWDHDGLCRFRRIGVPIVAGEMAGRGSAGGEHERLRASAIAWLRGIGVSDLVTERGYPGGVADVLSPGRRLAVECGWTEERKLINAAERGYACVWLPYHLTRTWRQGETADALLLLIPHARRGETIRRPIRPTALASESSSRFLGI